MLKLRTDISIEIDADDFVAAAEHQRRMQVFMESLKGDYPQADMVIKERRGPRLTPRARNELRLGRSGFVSSYADPRRAQT